MSPKQLSFDDFRKRAADPTLALNDKIGFGDAYRGGKDQAIFEDIVSCLAPLREVGKSVVDIGPGCGELPKLLIELCARQKHRLALVDSAEMLSLLPDGANVQKIPGEFPEDKVMAGLRGSADAVIVYSVLHHVYANADLHAFIDGLLEVMRPGAMCLLGDIPNHSMRRRFFGSDAGKEFHRRFMSVDTDPEISPEPAADEIDDEVIFGIVRRVRGKGFHCFSRQQGAGLPFANRREDLLIVRP